MTLGRRFALAVSAAVALTVVAASIVVYVTARAELRGQVDDALRALVPDVEVGAPGDVVVRRRLFGQRVFVPPDEFGGPTGIAQAVLPDGRVLGPSGAGEVLPADEQALQVARGERPPFFRDAELGGTRLRVYTAQSPIGGALQVARPLAEVDGSLSRLRWILLLVAAGGVGAAALLGRLVARTALAPVGRLTESAEHVARTQDLSHRLPASGEDEIGRLGTSFNTMLGALESSRAAQRQLVADASHELRTPLTSVRTNLELLARAPGIPAEERERIVAASAAQLEELTVLVGDLVDLARPSGSNGDAEPEDVRLDLLVAEAVRRAQGHAPDCRFQLDASETLVRGVPGQLHRAVANLLDNAVKHGPRAGPVEVTVGKGRVVVRDHGPGVAAADLPHVFDRFYRAPGARGLPGSGLGLAIVRRVAEAHGGRVRAEAAPGGGARLVLELSGTS